VLVFSKYDVEHTQRCQDDIIWAFLYCHLSTP